MGMHWMDKDIQKDEMGSHLLRFYLSYIYRLIIN